MKLIKSASRWGWGYYFRYFFKGQRISKAVFEELYDRYGFTPERGTLENTDFGFRKVWSVS